MDGNVSDAKIGKTAQNNDKQPANKTICSCAIKVRSLFEVEANSPGTKIFIFDN